VRGPRSARRRRTLLGLARSRRRGSLPGAQKGPRVGASRAGPWAGLPEALGERLREWRDATLRRTLRIVMDGYRAGNGET
jgi:hypothetical protein